MANGLAALHDAHNRRLTFKVAVLRHPLVGLLVLLLGFFELNLIDPDTIPWMFESQVDSKGIGRVNLLAQRMFGDGSQLCASQRLQGALDFCFRYRTVRSTTE